MKSEIAERSFGSISGGKAEAFCKTSSYAVALYCPELLLESDVQGAKREKTVGKSCEEPT